MSKFAKKKKKPLIIAVLDYVRSKVAVYDDFDENDPRFEDDMSLDEKIEMWLELEKGHDMDNSYYMSKVKSVNLDLIKDKTIQRTFKF